MSSLARTLWLLAALLVTVPSLPAQDDLSKKEDALNKSAVGILTGFARAAKSKKVATRAKRAYDLILERYDPQNGVAARELGYVKTDGKWVPGPPNKAPEWVDKANNEQRFQITEDWSKTKSKLGDLHRQLGLELVGGEYAARGKEHLQQAVAYNPFDKDAHLALGHIEHEGFYGTEADIAFIQKMREIETKALDLARQEYEVEALPLDKLPEELAKLNLEFHGSQSKHFTVWTRGTQENADNCAKWNERALDFLMHLLGPEQSRRRGLARLGRSRQWKGFVWTAGEREEFLKLNPHIYEGKTIEEAKQFSNVSWMSKQGPAMVLVKLTPASMHDYLIASLPHELFGNSNGALLEGLHHAMTWYLMSTSITQYAAVPDGTASAKELMLPESTNWWLRKIRDQAIAGTDWPLNQVPRERLSNFRNDVRVKAWSFMTWVVARYPDRWMEFFQGVPADKIPFPEEIDQIGAEAFGKPLAEVEAEWREWARGDSTVAAATGYGPPLLPEKPNKEELAVLERMNEVRNTPLAYTVPEDQRDLRDGSMGILPPCDLDAEASMACEAHATYLTMWTEEHLKWPEAHEENPAREGFSPRGMRAGMRSVIVFLNGNGGVNFARDSVDGWIGTVYHRFPLLEHNINRFGYSYVYDNGWSVAVLDMGSLEEPYDPNAAPRFVCWPPPDMKDVPRQFHGIEHPNPLDDQPESERDITVTGYPVSLQIQRELAQQVTEAGISLYEVPKARSKAPTKHYVAPTEPVFKEWSERRGDSVATWNHTPMEPLLKRMELREVVFAIPKEHLKPKTTYQVEVRVKLQNEAYFIWEFTTGSQMEGLKF
ncbi:MAG: CAP domain-containing protein [Planctomycetota bacterium]